MPMLPSADTRMTQLEAFYEAHGSLAEALMTTPDEGRPHTRRTAGRPAHKPARLHPGNASLGTVRRRARATRCRIVVVAGI